MTLAAIRIRCAEIVGWTEIRQGTSDVIGTSTDGRICWQLPNYPESADAALQLVEWMEKEGWEVMSDNFNLKGQKKPKWHLSFHKVDCPLASADAETFQLAVCLAFLKANNIDPDLLQ